MSLELPVTDMAPVFLLRQVLCNFGIDISLGIWSKSQFGYELFVLWASCWSYVAAHPKLSSCSARPWPGMSLVIGSTFHCTYSILCKSVKPAPIPDVSTISTNKYFVVLLQFVRVLQNMAKDLGFFGLVWAILVFAFSVFMLGATDGAQCAALADNTSAGRDAQPMQAWSTWWILRTYLQSLGQVHPSLCFSVFK